MSSASSPLVKAAAMDLKLTLFGKTLTFTSKVRIRDSHLEAEDAEARRQSQTETIKLISSALLGAVSANPKLLGKLGDALFPPRVVHPRNRPPRVRDTFMLLVGHEMQARMVGDRVFEVLHYPEGGQVFRYVIDATVDGSIATSTFALHVDEAMEQLVNHKWRSIELHQNMKVQEALDTIRERASEICEDLTEAEG